MPVQYILGLGTGRCGSATLSTLLDQQKGICCFHEGEYMPWDRDIVAFYQSIVRLLNKATESRIGNVAFYWKNYLPEIFRDLLNPKVIVLKREKEKVVESFASLYQDKNHWSTPGGKNWDGRDPQDAPIALMMPKYDLNKKDAIAQYWEEYYNDGAIDYYLNMFPQNIMLMASEDFWLGEDAQKRIFDFLDIPEESMVFDTDLWKNKRPDEKRKFIEFDNQVSPEFEKVRLNKALYGAQAMAIVGMSMDVDVKVTSEQMKQITDDPKIMDSLEEKVNG